MTQVTQHNYPTTDAEGHPVGVAVGWHKAKQEFYIKVFPKRTDGTWEDVPVNSTIIHDHGGTELDTCFVDKWLTLNGYSMPQSVFEALDDDTGDEIPDTKVKFYDAYGIPTSFQM